MAKPERDDPDGDLKRRFAAAPAEGACLDDAMWERLASQELMRFERERAFDHLTTCDGCGSIYRALRTLEVEARPFDPGVPVRPLSGERRWWRPEVTGSWRVFPQAAALMMLVAALGAVLAWNVSLRRTNARLETALAGAASVRSNAPAPTDDRQIAEMRRRLDEALAPQLNVPLVSLEPDALRGDPGSATIALPPDAKLVTLVLNTADDRAYQDYELRILDSGGSVVWSGRGLRKSRYNTFTLSVPRDILGAGDYRLELAGVRDGGRGAVQTFQIHVVTR